MTAAAARMAGLRAVLVLTAKSDQPAAEGNLLLDYLYGAEVRFVPAVDPMYAVGQDEAAVAEVVADEARAGPKGLRHPRRRLERRRRARLRDRHRGARRSAARDERVTPSRLYYASGSRGTQAGLTLGAKLSNAPYQLWGVAVSAGEPEKIERARKAANDAAVAPQLADPRRTRRSLHRSGFHRRGLRHRDRRRSRGDQARRRHRGDSARSRLHVQGDGGAHPPRARRRDPRVRHRRLSAHRRLPCALHRRRPREPWILTTMVTTTVHEESSSQP